MSKHLARPISAIVAEIEADWRKPFYGAIPYIEGMRLFGSATDLAATYGSDDLEGVVLYFLSNAKTWRGDVAREIKAELRAALEGKNPAPAPKGPTGKKPKSRRGANLRSVPRPGSGSDDWPGVQYEAEVEARLNEQQDMTDHEAGEVLAAEKCGKCKGFGLVRGVGKNAGEAYKKLNGAQQALTNGNAVDCPVCEGTGLIGLAV